MFNFFRRIFRRLLADQSGHGNFGGVGLLLYFGAAYLLFFAVLGGVIYGVYRLVIYIIN